MTESILVQIAENLAKNTTHTENILKRLDTLNGKVATQESFTRTLQASVDLQAATLQGIVASEKHDKENREKLTWLTIENIFKAVFAVAIAYLLYKAGLN